MISRKLKAIFKLKMNREIIISNRKIGLSHAPLVIAEIGINHGGSLEVAKNMAKKAIDSGVDVVKSTTGLALTVTKIGAGN